MGGINQNKPLNILFYILTKLTGAGFLFFVMAVYIFFLNKFDWYNISETFQEGLLWFVVFIYGIASSLIIDLIASKTKTSLPRKIILYIIAGYLIFLIQGINIFTFIAGTVGAIAALVYFYGSTLPNKSKSMSYILAFVIPVALFIITFIDFTEKQEWTEQREANMYTASFEYFNGEHEIPIELEKGEAIDITSTFHPLNEGGYGFHVKSEENDYVGLTEMPDDVLRLNAKDAGVYNLVITGTQLEGKVTVYWDYVGDKRGN